MGTILVKPSFNFNKIFCLLNEKCLYNPCIILVVCAKAEAQGTIM